MKLRHPVSYYFLNNVWVTTSGVGWEPAVTIRDGLRMTLDASQATLQQ